MTASSSNDRTYKEGVRREWTAAATGWRKWIGTLEGDTAGPVVTSALLEQAGVRRGDHVLDVGSGYGEPGLSAAKAVGPTGHVTCLDISADMLAFAEERSRSYGLANVTFVEGDIETTELEPERFDVVLSRATLMYAADPLATLRRLNAALRPGGRLAVAVWATPDKVAFATPVPVMVDMLGIDVPTGGPGPFALGGDGVLEKLVRDAGFTDVVSGTTVATYRTPSAQACTEWVRDVAPPITELIADQPAPVQEQVWERVTQAWAPFQGPDGAVQLPCTAVWVGATRR
jgi:ubiquinone/menaquinone biosynthesis C-methylase UbiE